MLKNKDTLNYCLRLFEKDEKGQSINQNFDPKFHKKKEKGLKFINLNFDKEF